MLASVWKKTRISPTPASDCDSMCSMLLTVVVIARSEMVTMRPSTSFGESPVNCQRIEMTGMLISGKMSTGVRAMVSTPPMAISIAITMNVYGRRRARRTIHIAQPMSLPFARFAALRRRLRSQPPCRRELESSATRKPCAHGTLLDEGGPLGGRPRVCVPIGRHACRPAGTRRLVCLARAEAYAADQLLRGRDQPRGHAEGTEAEPEKLRHRFLAPCQLAAQRDRHAWRVRDGDRQQPQDGGMRVVVVTAHGGIVPPRSERVLREVVRADGEEVHVAGDRGDAERG